MWNAQVGKSGYLLCFSFGCLRPLPTGFQRWSAASSQDPRVERVTADNFNQRIQSVVPEVTWVYVQSDDWGVGQYQGQGCSKGEDAIIQRAKDRLVFYVYEDGKTASGKRRRRALEAKTLKEA